MALLPIEDLQARPPLTGLAPLQLGFRPFFWPQELYAVLDDGAVAARAARQPPSRQSVSPVWHGHEMLSVLR